MNDAALGRSQCRLHEAMPPDYLVLGELQGAAYQIGHVVISRGSYMELLNDRERLKQLRESGQ